MKTRILKLVLMISVLAFSLSLSQISVQAIDHYSVINK